MMIRFYTNEWHPPMLRYDGLILFLRDTDAFPFKTLYFENAFCINLHDSFSKQSNAQMTTTVTILASKVTFEEKEKDDVPLARGSHEERTAYSYEETEVKTKTADLASGNTPKSKLRAGTPEHKSARWEAYQKRKGEWSYDKWSKQYDTNMRNVKHGLAQEQAYRDKFGGTSETVKTDFTNRQIDIHRPDELYAGQLKTGRVSLTEQAKIDIQKDAWLVREEYTVEYILEKGASKNFLQALEKSGIEYKLGIQL